MPPTTSSSPASARASTRPPSRAAWQEAVERLEGVRDSHKFDLIRRAWRETCAKAEVTQPGG
ncbi:MAG: hypothetical protein AAB074_11740 [Planctomycetota bacterium]